MSQQKDAHMEKERLSKKANRHIETEEECAKRKKTTSDWMSRKRQSDTDEQGAKRKKTVHDCVMRKHQTETDEQRTKRKKTNRDCLRRNCEDKRHQSQNDNEDCRGEHMRNVINWATKEATQFYSGHRIFPTPISTGQLCVLYVIDSLLAQKPSTNLPRKPFMRTVKDLVSKVMKSTMKPH